MQSSENYALRYAVRHGKRSTIGIATVDDLYVAGNQNNILGDMEGPIIHRYQRVQVDNLRHMTSCIKTILAATTFPDVGMDNKNKIKNI